MMDCQEPRKSQNESQEDKRRVKKQGGPLVSLAFLLALPKAPWIFFRGNTFKEMKVSLRASSPLPPPFKDLE